MQDDTVQINLGYDASQALKTLKRAQAVIDDLSLASAMAAVWDACSSAAKACAAFADAMRPAVDKAVKSLADAGYTYDAERQVFVRGFGDTPIAVHRILRYAEQPPTNRRRGRERRKVTRRVRKHGGNLYMQAGQWRPQ